MPTVEIVVLLRRGDVTMESVVDGSNLALYCTPAINLFHKRTDRIHVTESAHEYHVVADRTRPLDFEVYDVTSVNGHGAGTNSEQEFRPFYSAYSSDQEHQDSAYYTTRREPRLVASASYRRGSRTSYIGTEVFLSLVDSKQAPFSGDLRQLSIQAMCTNRDLVLQMPMGIGRPTALDVAAPVASIRVISGPSRPYAPLADGAVAWRAISHLSLNYLSLVQTNPQEGAAAARSAGAMRASTDVSAKKQSRASAASKWSGSFAAWKGRVRWRSAADSRSRCRSTSSRSRVAARTCLDRCSIAILHVTSRSTRSRKR